MFASEEEMNAYLDDPDQVTRALRDYIWSLSRDSAGTAAAAGGGAAALVRAAGDAAQRPSRRCDRIESRSAARAPPRLGQ